MEWRPQQHQTDQHPHCGFYGRQRRVPTQNNAFGVRTLGHASFRGCSDAVFGDACGRYRHSMPRKRQIEPRLRRRDSREGPPLGLKHRSPYGRQAFGADGVDAGGAARRVILKDNRTGLQVSALTIGGQLLDWGRIGVPDRGRRDFAPRRGIDRCWNQFFVDLELIQAVCSRSRPLGRKAFPTIARADRCTVACNA